MRFMMLVIPKGYATTEPVPLPSAELIAKMMKFNEELTAAGALIALDGLHPPASAARITFKGGKATATDGPFAEVKELIGGYWMIRAKSREEAIAWALRVPALDGDVIEVRQVQEMEEFPAESIPAISPELRKIGAASQ